MSVQVWKELFRYSFQHKKSFVEFFKSVQEQFPVIVVIHDLDKYTKRLLFGKLAISSRELVNPREYQRIELFNQ